MVLLTSLGISALAVWYTLQMPWLGVTLKATKQSIIVEASQVIPAGGQVLALVSNSQRIDLLPTDLMEDPDSFETYLQMNAFSCRQNAIYTQLQGPVEVVWKTADSVEQRTLITPQNRPLSALPFALWWELGTGIIACLISCWIWSLRRQDWGTRMYAITGIMFLATIIPVTLSSNRPLALDSMTWQVLLAFNHLTITIYGSALIGLFLTYPRMLVKPRTLLWLPLIYGFWWLADVMQLMPNLSWGNSLTIFTQLMLAVLFAVIQWRRCRSNPLERAALRWFLLSVFPACFLAVLPILTFMMFGRIPLLNPEFNIQNPFISTGTLLIMYIGTALGLSRYHLFDLDEWAYRILLWVGGAAMVILVDAAFVLLLKSDPTVSLGISLIVAGLVYFPVRQWLWLRYVSPNHMSIEQAMPDIIRIAFVDSLRERERQWDDLLRAMYNPLEMTRLAAVLPKAKLDNDGLALHVPACGGLPARAMRYPQQGHRLFSTRDVAFVDALCQLMEHAAAGRIAYEQGATQERRRISRDMHDDVGARLLMLIHRAKDEPTAEVARAAMRDLRTALNSLDAKSAPLAEALADWKQETETRCDAANVMLEWHEPAELPEYELSPQEKSTLERVLREMLSNVLKHASPKDILVETRLEADALHIAMSNAAPTASSDNWQEGRGMRNMRARLAEIGGVLNILQRDRRDMVTLVLPFAR